MRVVVTGANRGIGLELVRQLRARGDEVEACARNPAAPALQALAGERVRLHSLDVTEPASVKALADALGSAALDVVFNVAGVYGGALQSLGQMAEDLALDDVTSTSDVNALGPLRVSLALLPHLRRGRVKKLVHVSSAMGSISDNASGGYYAYRMSKAALNMMSRCLAVDLRHEGITSGGDQPRLGADRHGRSRCPDEGRRLGEGPLARGGPRDARRLRRVSRLDGRPLRLVNPPGPEAEQAPAPGRLD